VTIPLSPDIEPEAAEAPHPVEALRFPLSSFLRDAPSAIQYRAIIDVSGLEADKMAASALALSYQPALALALAQDGDGLWASSILRTPDVDDPTFASVGTIPAFRRLLEYGWDRESPPLTRARRILFRLLAEDDDPDQLHEFAEEADGDPDLIHRARSIMREASAAALAHAGYESDPRLRGAARRILARVDAYLQSPIAEKPWIRVGNRLVLAPEANPPSIHVLTMIAHMPLFRSENHAPVSRLLAHVSQSAPRQDTCQLLGKTVVAQPHFVMGDPLGTRLAAEADIPFALTWLELMARLQFLRRHEGWLQVLDRFVGDCDRDHLWRQRRTAPKLRTANPESWAQFSLGRPGTEEDRSWDVTFRIGLISRLLGRSIELT
jgi:hypothetical protein